MTYSEKGFVLVVDDNEDLRDLLGERLERKGHRVMRAENGLQALELLQQHDFDLMLLDIMMPEMNGYQVLEWIKADLRLRHLPVVVVSAVNELDSIVKCVELGAADYILKPIKPVLLHARVNACLEKKWHLRQLELERQRADELLRVILPESVIAELKENGGRVKPRLYNNVAVLFCDIVDFTPYCDTHHPEEVFLYLQQLVESFESLVLDHDMQKIKTSGDAFMATAGLLVPVANPVLHCVQCGLAMVAAAQQLESQWQVRVGIHVGPVMAGVVGHKQYLFDIWGDTVNTAQRIESVGRNNAVNLSSAAWEQVAHLCEGASQGLVQVKGKGNMEIFQVLALHG